MSPVIACLLSFGISILTAVIMMIVAGVSKNNRSFEVSQAATVLSFFFYILAVIFAIAAVWNGTR